jgi:hypothetical protein
MGRARPKLWLPQFALQSLIRLIFHRWSVGYMEQTLAASRVSLNDFESFHSHSKRPAPPPPSFKELALTVLTAVFMTPFFYVTFFVIPLMGQVTVGFAALITGMYLYYRRSLLVLLATVGTVTLFSVVVFATIQSVKYRLEIPLFICIALGIPFSFAYCVLVGSRIWVVRGGAD